MSSRPASAGVIVRARKKELPTARITLRAIGPTNSPAPPGMSAMGAKAMRVVSVEPNSGTARCRTAPDTASAADAPDTRRWRTSSTTTIALSMSNEGDDHPGDRHLMQRDTEGPQPLEHHQRRERRAVPTRSAARQPIVKTITTITSKAPAGSW